jgi:DNA-binding CsgD family transcriptional regulator
LVSPESLASADVVGPGSAPLVADVLRERTAELAAIERAVRDVVAGDGRLLVFQGPAGIGKSSLLKAARDRAGAVGMDVLSARGGELERRFGFGVARQLFEAAVRDGRSGRRLLAGTARLAAPVLGVELGQDGPPAPRDPGEAGFAVQHGLYRLTVQLAERRPVALVVDDAHWADRESLGVLLHLARRLEGLPVLLAVATRPPSDVDRLLHRLAATAGAEVLAPAPLSAAATGEIVRSLAPAADDEVCRICHARTGGNPFYLREMASELRSERLEQGPAAAARLAGWSPKRVNRYVGARVAAVPAPARSLARAAAVLDQDAHVGHAAAIARLDRATADEAADALRGAGILSSGPALAFAHPIVRSAVYEEIPAAARAAAHARAAHLLADDGASAERIAAQLVPCEPRSDSWASDRLLQAGREALARGASAAATEYLRRALAEPPPDAARASLLLELGVAEASAYEPGPATDHLRQAFEAAADPAERRRAALLLASLQTQDGLGAEGVELVRRVLEECADDRALATSVAAQLVNLARFQVSTRPLAHDVAARLRARVDAGEEGTAVLATVAAEMAMAGESATRVAELATRVLERPLDPAESMGDYSFIIAVRSLIVAEALELATRVLDEAIDAAADRGAAFDLRFLMVFRSDAAYRRGAVLDAEADARTGYDLALENEWLIGVPASVAYLVIALIERAELDEAARVVDEAGLGGPAAALPDHYTIHLLLHARGRLRIAAGALDDGLADLRECGRRQTAIGERNPSLIPWRSDAAPALLLTGETGEARRMCAEELELARAFGAPRAIGMALRAAGAVEGGERGLELVREAVAVLARSPARLEHARALADLGEMLERDGRRADACDILRQALELAHRCGARALEERAFGALRAAGARPRRPVLSGPDALTASERRVAELAARGMANREIAESLFVTVRTVEFHLSHSYRKLGIDSRSKLAAALGQAILTRTDALT